MTEHDTDIGGANTGLLIGRSTVESCVGNLLAAETDPKHVLRVEFDRKDGEWFERWAGSTDARPETLAVVNATGVSWSDGSSSLPSSVALLTETGPGNLTGIGSALTQFLYEREASGARPIVCIHSLTTLLQYVGSGEAFQFLHQLTEQARAVGAFVHFHLAAEIHDDPTVNLFSTLADVVVDVESDGTWSVRPQ